MTRIISCDELIEKVILHYKNADPKIIKTAYDLSQQVHHGQLRASGEPYFIHPLAVADILCDLKLDPATVVTALLHDAVEDTHITLEEIEAQFGSTIAQLVDGVTKLSKFKFRSNKTEQAENFRKLVLAMSKDIRVLLVKLIDRLHNMRTIHHIKNSEKRIKKARETMEIYAPLAERIGLYKIKEELQDLSFQQINPTARDSIINRIKDLKDKNDTIIEMIISELRELLESRNLKGDISGRTKKPYSIWSKMQRQNISFEEVTDIIAFRIIVDNNEDCYTALGVVHDKYHFIAGKIKDYISTPKYNGYRSIHTTVHRLNSNTKMEIQIRSWEMNEFAERGVAAHWSYKQRLESTLPNEEQNNYQWLRVLLEILESSEGSEDFLEHSKLEMFNDYIYCFSPKGDITNLPVGATVIDFAYSVHSDVGNHCAAAKVNGNMVPLRSVLNNGDEVEIITKEKQHPNANWEKIAITGKAKTNIRKFLRNFEQEKYIAKGEQLLKDTLKKENIKFGAAKIDKIRNYMKFNNLDDFYYAIGNKSIRVDEIILNMYPNHQLKTNNKELADAKIEQRIIINSENGEIVNLEAINGLVPGIAIHFGKCCHPLPGDSIVGIVHTGQGITVHTKNCEILQRYETEPNRWLDINWNKDK